MGALSEITNSGKCQHFINYKISPVKRTQVSAFRKTDSSESVLDSLKNEEDEGEDGD